MKTFANALFLELSYFVCECSSNEASPSISFFPKFSFVWHLSKPGVAILFSVLFSDVFLSVQFQNIRKYLFFKLEYIMLSIYI